MTVNVVSPTTPIYIRLLPAGPARKEGVRTSQPRDAISERARSSHRPDPVVRDDFSQVVALCNHRPDIFRTKRFMDDVLYMCVYVDDRVQRLRVG